MLFLIISYDFGATLTTVFFWNFTLGFFFSLKNFFFVSILISVSVSVSESEEHDSIVMGSLRLVLQRFFGLKLRFQSMQWENLKSVKIENNLKIKISINAMGKFEKC